MMENYQNVLNKKVSRSDSYFKRLLWQDFPGSPVVETSPSNAQGVGWIPDQKAKILHVSWPKNPNIRYKQYCKKFNKDFKNGPHQKKKKSLEKKIITFGEGIRWHIRSREATKKGQYLGLRW